MVFVVLRPSPYFGVEEADQVFLCGGLIIIVYQLPDACQEVFNVLLGRFDHHLPVVLAEIPAQKVETF